jgi:hypothetical protein
MWVSSIIGLGRLILPDGSLDIGYSAGLIGCHGQTVLNLRKLFDTFVQLGLKIIYAKFHEDWT